MTSFNLHFVVNLLLAIIWLLLSPETNLTTFVIGFLVGFGILALFTRVAGGQDYVRRCGAFVRFVFIFSRQFVVSNYQIAKAIFTRPNETIRPNLITYDVSGLSQWEILLLSQCITLTPGTTTVDVTDEFRTLIIHVFDADDPDGVRRDLEHGLKQPILAFTR